MRVINIHRLEEMSTVKFQRTLNKILNGEICYRAMDGRICDFGKGIETVNVFRIKGE